MNIDLKSPLLKKPEIYPYINMKTTIFFNNLTNSGLEKKYKKIINPYSKKSKSVEKKYNISYQINELGKQLFDYTKKNLEAINKIQTINNGTKDMIKDLHNNIVKNRVIKNTTNEIFHDLILEYKNKGYKIPNLSLKNNLFKKNPLLIETKKDVEVFYDNCNEIKGDFITDIETVEEKNFVYLNKLKKIVEIQKEKISSENNKLKQKAKNNENEKIDKILEENRKEREKNYLIENLEKYKNDVKIIKNTIKNFENEEKEKKIIPKEQMNILNSPLFKTLFHKKIKSLQEKKNKKKGTLFNTISTYISSNGGSSPTLKNFNQILLTTIKKRSNKQNNKIEKQKQLNSLYNKLKSSEFYELKKLNNNIENYFIKNNKKISFINLNNYPLEMSQSIKEMKSINAKYNVINDFQQSYNLIGKLGRFNKHIKSLTEVNYNLNNIDKYYVSHTIKKQAEL